MATLQSRVFHNALLNRSHKGYQDCQFHRMLQSCGGVLNENIRLEENIEIDYYTKDG